MKLGAPSAGLERQRNRANSQKRAAILMGGECIPRTTSQEFGNSLSLTVGEGLVLLTRRQKMPRSVAKPIKVNVDIRPGPVTPAHKAAWRKFWAKLLSDVKREQ